MQAVIYTSNTGNTKKYAEILGEKTGLPVYSSSSAPKLGGEVIYLGWVMASTVSGLSDAMQSYNVKAVCAVGMAPESSEKINSDIIEKNHIEVPFFYLPGGFNIKKLSGMYKLMMGMMSKKIKSELQAKPEKTKADEMMIKMFTEGVDYVDEQHLQQVIDSLF